MRVMCAVRLLLVCILFCSSVGCSCGPVVQIEKGILATDMANHRIEWFASDSKPMLRTFTLYNRGESDLEVTSLRISGAVSASFRLVSPPSLPLVLTPGKEQGISLTVQSASDKFATQVGRLAIVAPTAQNADQNGEFFIALERVFLRGRLVMSCKGKLAFGELRPGKSKRLICALSNSGTAPVLINDIVYKGELGNQAFSLGGVTFPLVLPVGGASADMWVRFAPKVDKRAIFKGTYLFDTDLPFLPGESQPKLSVEGIFVLDRPCLKVKTLLTSREPVEDQCGTLLQTIRVENIGGLACDSLYILRLNVDGKHVTKAHNSLGLKLPYQLNVGESVDILLRYAPLGEKAIDANLIILTDHAVHPVYTERLVAGGGAHDPRKDKHIQQTLPTIDLFFVFDDLYPTSRSANHVRDQIAKLMADFFSWPFDWQVKALHADTAKSTRASLGCGQQVIHKQTSKPVQAFFDSLNIGSGMARSAQALEVASRGLAQANPTGCNRGFFREGASVMFVFVSANDDQSPRSVLSYVSEYPRAKSSKKWESLSFFFYGGGNAGCTFPDGAKSTAAPRYLTAVGALGGKAFSICDKSWAPWKPNSSWVLKKTFPLLRLPALSTLKVFVDGKEVTEDAVNGWTYDPANNEVTFHGKQIPTWGSNIELSYQRGCRLQ